MKERLMEKLTEEGKENSNAIREELRADFQAQFDAKEQDMKARFEQEHTANKFAVLDREMCLSRP